VSMRVLLHGTDELRNALAQLPAALNRDARAIVQQAAHETARQARSANHDRSGALDKGISVRVTNTSTTVTAKVRSAAKHAAMWEYGSRPHRRTNKNANRGRMPDHGGAGLINASIRERAIMTAQLIALVRNAGFTVSG